jgi:hypothetical protein
MYAKIIIITILTVIALYFLTTIEHFEITPTVITSVIPFPDSVVIPTEAPKKPPAPYIPYIRFGDQRKKFLIN